MTGEAHGTERWADSLEGRLYQFENSLGRLKLQMQGILERLDRLESGLSAPPPAKFQVGDWVTACSAGAGGGYQVECAMWSDSARRWEYLLNPTRGDLFPEDELELIVQPRLNGSSQGESMLARCDTQMSDPPHPPARLEAK